MTAEKVCKDPEPSALDVDIALLEIVAVVSGVPCSFESLLVVMSEAAGVLDSALLTVKVGVLELGYLAELCIGVVPFMLYTQWGLGLFVRVIASGCHAGVDDRLMPALGCVEDIESAIDIVLEGNSDACVNVLAVVGTGSWTLLVTVSVVAAVARSLRYGENPYRLTSPSMKKQEPKFKKENTSQVNNASLPIIVYAYRKKTQYVRMQYGVWLRRLVAASSVFLY
jgi:hypothetical protein